MAGVARLRFYQLHLKSCDSSYPKTELLQTTSFTPKLAHTMRKKSASNWFLVLIVWACCISTAYAQEDSSLRVAGVFGDNMVLQREKPIPVWGWADSGQAIKVTLEGKSTEAKADKNGKWLVELEPMSAGGPYELTVAGKKEISFANVMVGEVWLCSGQSNMAMTVQRSQDFDNEKELADLPDVRMMTVDRVTSPNVKDDCAGSWTVASPKTVGNFSATAWFFGQKLHQELGVPVGLINSSWGGTDVAAWTSSDAQKQHEVLAEKMLAFDKSGESYDAAQAKSNFELAIKRWEEKKAAGEKPGRKPRLRTDPMVNQNRPSNLFNSMIHPLIPYGIRGAIWYQGERNSKSIAAGQLYALQLKTMITDWRKRWSVGDFPFITVQLPNFRKATDQPVQNTGWVLVRESQKRSLSLKNTGLVVTTDVGMANDIHPKNKQAVGTRLALWALGATYKKDILYSGPEVGFVQFAMASDTRNGRCTILPVNIGEGLMTNDGSEEMKGFAIAGEDGVFYKAKAFFSNKNRKLNVSSDEVEDPVAVRYNWADNPVGNVVNSAGLPMGPFRTDSWEITDPGQ
jgi:sialate O-acetylesterase